MQHKINICAGIVVLLITPLIAQAVAQEVRKTRDGVKGIPFRYQSYAQAAGMRFRYPGKERITATGKLVRYGAGLESATSAAIIWEFPLKVRLDLPDEVLTFDANNTKNTVPTDIQSGEVLQMLLEDSLEGFLGIVGSRGSSRDMGSGYRLPDANPEDSCMDIVHTAYPNAFNDRKIIEKIYWFDCKTKLLGTVTYLSSSGSRVLVVISDWREVAGELLPFGIDRWEDGKLTLRLTMDEATISAAAVDSTFEGK
jgi:hypothetical protein